MYMLFGKVVGMSGRAGAAFPAVRSSGPPAFVVNFLGNCHVLDLRLDQEYLRSQPVNSEEGAPMGIGIWYEMWISDPVSYLFKNTDPRGSLRANVSNATVRCLSNMPLAEMLETRHQMSQTVRAEVTGKSQEWGYQLGSVYIRKVHFRDAGMIRQIEEKVVNRLRQVTSAIKQAGANQVSVITSSAEREAAVEFAKAAAMRPATLGRRCRRSRASRRSPRRCSRFWRRRGFWPATRASRCCRAGRTPAYSPTCWPRRTAPPSRQDRRRHETPMPSVGAGVKLIAAGASAGRCGSAFHPHCWSAVIATLGRTKRNIDCRRYLAIARR